MYALFLFYSTRIFKLSVDACEENIREVIFQHRMSLILRFYIAHQHYLQLSSRNTKLLGNINREVNEIFNRFKPKGIVQNAIVVLHQSQFKLIFVQIDVHRIALHSCMLNVGKETSR